MPAPRTSTFLQNLRASALLDDTQLQEIEQLPAAKAGDDRALARELVARGVLTQFQAEHILAGHIHGFFMGPYTVLDRIGSGGMGRVYKAVHRQMHRTVALKILPRSSRADPAAQARFMREVRASANLNHPNIVTAYDVGEEGNIVYLAMEYVEGTDLYRLIRQRGRLEPAHAAEIAYQVALALQHAHERGIVHRDVKPSNILITQQGTAKVLDMGLARFERGEVDAEASATLTQDGAVMGTLDFMAPEQARDSHGADTRSDIYSLGCTLYHMLTGKVPFPGGSPTDKLYRHLMEEPADPTTLVPDVPAGLTDVVMRMVSKRPEDRYQNPVEVASALLPWVGPSGVQGVGFSATHPGTAPQVGPGDPTRTSPGATQPTPPPDSASTQSVTDLHMHGLGRKGRVSRMIGHARSMLANWRKLRRTLQRDQGPTAELGRLIDAILADYRRLPKIFAPPGVPGRIGMSLLQAGATWTELKAQLSDIGRGEGYLKELVGFLKDVLRRLHHKGWVAYQAGVMVDVLKEGAAHPRATLLAAGGLIAVLWLLSLIPGGKIEQEPNGSGSPDVTDVATNRDAAPTPGAGKPPPEAAAEPQPAVKAAPAMKAAPAKKAAPARKAPPVEKAAPAKNARPAAKPKPAAKAKPKPAPAAPEPARTFERPSPPAEQPAEFVVDARDPKAPTLPQMLTRVMKLRGRASVTVDVADRLVRLTEPLPASTLSLHLRGARPYGTWLVVTTDALKAPKPSGQPGEAEEKPSAPTVLRLQRGGKLKRIHFWLGANAAPARDASLLEATGEEITLMDCSFTSVSRRIVCLKVDRAHHRYTQGLGLTVMRCAFRGVDVASVRGNVDRFVVQDNVVIGCQTFLSFTPFGQAGNSLQIRHNTVVSNGTFLSVGARLSPRGRGQPVRAMAADNVICGLTRPMPCVVALASEALLGPKPKARVKAKGKDKAAGDNGDRLIMWQGIHNHVGQFATFCTAGKAKLDWPTFESTAPGRRMHSFERGTMDPKATVAFSAPHVRTMKDRTLRGGRFAHLYAPQAWALSTSCLRALKIEPGKDEPGFRPAAVWVPPEPPPTK